MAKVKLLNGLGEPVEFTYRQAEALLIGEAKMKHGVWSLPENSKYEFKDNGLILRRDKKHTGRKAESGDAGKGTKAREQAEVPRGNDTE